MGEPSNKMIFFDATKTIKLCQISFKRGLDACQPLGKYLYPGDGTTIEEYKCIKISH